MEKFKEKNIGPGYIHAVPRPSQAELDDFYTKLYFKAGVTDTYQDGYPEDEFNHKRMRADVITLALQKSLRSIEGAVELLEIGSGEGFLIASAVDRGWSTLGVDFQVAPIKRFNSEILSNFKEQNPTEFLKETKAAGNTFNAIVLQNVLEHVLEPEQLLLDLGNLLKPGGRLLIQIPNDFSDLQLRALEERKTPNKYWFSPPQHLNYFSLEGIQGFCEQNAFEIHDIFSDFPIEWYLWGTDVNYAQDGTRGRLAHKARVTLDMMMASKGLDAYLDFCRALSKVGMGRSMALIISLR